MKIVTDFNDPKLRDLPEVLAVLTLLSLHDFGLVSGFWPLLNSIRAETPLISPVVRAEIRSLV